MRKENYEVVSSKSRFLVGQRSSILYALVLPALIVCGSTYGTAKPNTATPDTRRQILEKQFTRTVRPFLEEYCNACHGKDKPQAQLDLSIYASMDSVTKDFAHWSLVLDKLVDRQMPPKDSEMPSDKQRDAVIAWIRDMRKYESTRNAGDPGMVLARRLSNSEYDYTIRDLTGVDLHPTREFPVDPANQEGFDNSGESLTLSPGLAKKYIQAAKETAEHLALTSTGLEFASHPVLAETDRDKFGVLRIVDFYKKQPTDYADYFYAAWRYKHRAAFGYPTATLQGVAEKNKVSPRYLKLVWETLDDPAMQVGPLAHLQSMWNALPTPDKNQPDAVRTSCVEMRDWVVTLRKKLAWKFDNLKVPRGFSTGGQVFVLWKDRQYAAHRRKLYPNSLQIGGVPASRVIPERKRRDQTIPEHVETDPVDPELFAPEDEIERAFYLASFNQFCSIFPDAFYIAERGRMFINDPGDKGRLLSAGLHNSMGYFRDDTPLMELLLDTKEQQKLDHLWTDFDMVAFIPERMHKEFFVYERAESQTITDPEFNFARPEDKDAVSDEKIKRLADLYLAKAQKNGGEQPALDAITEHFQWVSRNIRSIERARLSAEPAHLRSLVDFAERAYRRPLTGGERASLLSFYRSLRQKDSLTHEDAIRDVVTGILMSPNFLFRLDLEDAGRPARAVTMGEETGLGLLRVNSKPPLATSSGSTADQPLSDYALANRLSYFLWSSMPDKELLAHAAAGDLHRPEVLKAQARRMVRDPRVRALALEFGGNWLDFRRFEEHNAVDRERFPAFNNDLREAMFEEPLRFLVDEFQQNRSVLDMVYGKHTFVNAPLAKHYGMTDVKTTGNEWVRVDNAARYNRGGLLPMAVFLTKNSPGLRTSPVKRGYWMVKRVLGEHIPPPPAAVPDLPSDESKLGDLTLRQALAQHRQNPACASCHARFDSYGLVFEGFGPVGQLRTTDMGGKPVDVRAPFPGGKERSGVAGLQAFVRQQRQDDFLDTLCRKMLTYSLGRSLQPSDDSTLLLMRERLTKGEYRFNNIVDTIVTSRQFLNRRTPSTVVRK